MFERLQPAETAVDRCARALRTAIIRGSLVPGARLPAERKLAEDFGVNRVTVRGALAQLANARLVTVRQGSGYVVRDFLRAGGPELIGQIAELAKEDGRLADVVRDLLAVRRALARVVLETIGARPNPNTDNIRDAINRFSAAIESGSEENIATADLDVLAAILDATESRVLGLFFNPVMRVVTTLPALRAAMYAAPETNVAGYAVLLHWLDANPRPSIELLLEELVRRDAITVDKIRGNS